MKSDLWKQRREKDGRLVTVWKSVKQLEEKYGAEISKEQKHSRLEEEQGDDPFLEEMVLTDIERRKLMELKQWHLTSGNPTNNINPSPPSKNQPS